MRLLAVTTGIDPILAAAVARYSAAGVAANTARTYASAWRCFEAWCSARSLLALPAAPMTCAAYLADRAAQLRPSSLSVHLAAIHQHHVARGCPSPTDAAEVLAVARGVRRAHGTAPRKKAALRAADLKAVVARLGPSARDCRDKALLLLGFCGGFRRSELVELDVDDVVFKDEGMLVRVRRSKTDQDGRGRTVAIEYGTSPSTCPANALEDWLSIASIRTGAIFKRVSRHGTVLGQRLQGRAVARVVQERAGAIGLDAGDLGGHSLRSGLATAAALARVDEHDISRRTGHRNLGVMRGYIQDVDPFAASITQRLGF